MGAKDDRIYIYENCDTKIATAIRCFLSRIEGHSTSSKSKSVWKLLGGCIDEDAIRFAKLYPDWQISALILEYGGLSKLGKFWSDHVCHIAAHDYAVAKSFWKNEGKDDLVAFVETLESLSDTMALAIAQTPGEITLKEPGMLRGGMRVKAYSKAERHFPYCELCWRLSEAARDHLAEARLSYTLNDTRRKKVIEKDEEDGIGSLRFCSVHNPSDPDSRYRAAHRYRDCFWREIEACRKRFLIARKSILSSYIDSPSSLGVQVNLLSDNGLSRDKIVAVTRLPEPVVDSILARYECTEYLKLTEKELQFNIADHAFIRQAAYLVAHDDLAGLIELEKAVPGLLLEALGDVIEEAFNRKLSLQSRNIVQLVLEGLTPSDIAGRLRISRQLVHNTTKRELVVAYRKFLRLAHYED
ncbi:hypothetical protein [Pseudomonas sp. TWR2-1-1]|uniref:hypothetical protein n=1 Tax=Pseudomonas sp. TWR2-1-1 TaxID=2804610 RepID=UPI003CF0B6E0